MNLLKFAFSIVFALMFALMGLNSASAQDKTQMTFISAQGDSTQIELTPTDLTDTDDICAECDSQELIPADNPNEDIIFIADTTEHNFTHSEIKLTEQGENVLSEIQSGKYYKYKLNRLAFIHLVYSREYNREVSEEDRFADAWQDFKDILMGSSDCGLHISSDGKKFIFSGYKFKKRKKKVVVIKLI